MVDPTDLGLSYPDPINGLNHPPRPHLCSACSQIDFKTLFTSHERPLAANEKRQTCKCFDIFDALLGHGWTHPKSANNSSEPPCCFCKFHDECLLRSKDMASGGRNVFRLDHLEEPRLWGFHSLAGFPIKHRGCEKGKCYQHHVQDVFALQLVGLSVYEFWYDTNAFERAGNAILPVVNGPKFPGLTRERAAGGGLRARIIIPHQVNYNIIGEWLSLCRSGHVHCDGDDADVVTIPGFQVIDCTTSKILSAVDLLANGREAGRVEYVTLSYVWGQAGEAGFNGPVMRENGLTLPDALPLVISDAIEVVKRLGYRYLWIDRYCIPQNDSPLKHIQIRMMDRIYSCSVLTIIAAAGDGPEYGLPGVSSRHRTEQLSVQVTEGISLVFYEMPRVSFGTSKWNTRGWTYQEALLSRRRLVFTDGMTYFQCYEMHGDEVLSLPLSGRYSSFGGKDQDGQSDDFDHISFERGQNDFGCIFPRRITDWSNPETAWDRIEQFAQRQLAFDQDTLDAIAGIFERYLSFNTWKRTEDRISFFCGLPVIPFLRGNQITDHLSRTPRTTSMQKLWSQYILDSAESAADETHANLTCRLVTSLLWYCKWNSSDFKSMGMPTDRESHLRRSGFPSWTWAGWKHCKIQSPQVDVRGTIFDSCTTVHVEYEDEAGILQRLDWVKDNDKIHNLSHQESRFPLYLLIKGTVMDMKLAWHTESGAGYSKLGGGYWIITSPQFMRKEKILAPRCLFEDIQLQSGDDRSSSTYLMRKEEVNVLGMTLAANMNSRGRQKLYAVLVMILRPVTRLLNGQPETMYERAHLLEVHDRLDYDRPQITGALRETVVRLC
ncbi:heterokaryon incompatibility protein-domain-containing protein [Neurospora hispaniola]|uniref:Heterokaryon incompatibility protein-domain-containing protein n=1 Tax=Neurospora hispaniola TaxID=588809 RepID=A0AAJ0I5F3_9PEZI|nr:heterokaryon incompatibility protein-domain-containing protein [Neurospora hispaniola]